jgi:hypothetical protein
VPKEVTIPDGYSTGDEAEASAIRVNEGVDVVDAPNTEAASEVWAGGKVALVPAGLEGVEGALVNIELDAGTCL